jgi:hypothetical protein
LATKRFGDLWQSSHPTPWVDYEKGWLAAASLSVELRRGDSPVPGLDAASRSFFSGSLPGIPQKVEWWHLPDDLYFNRRPEYGHLLIRRSDAAEVPHRIIIWPEVGLSRDDVGDYLLRRACALLLQRRGALILHASAIVLGGKAYLFMGHSGHGKSGLAGAFLQGGAPVLGDEMIPIERVNGRLVVLPGLPLLDLPGDLLRELELGELQLGEPPVDAGGLERGKRRIYLDWGSAHHSSRPAALGEIFHLSPYEREKRPESISLQPVSPRAGFFLLVGNSYHQILREPEVMRGQLELTAAISNRVKITQLAYPHGCTSPHSLRQAVLEHLRDTEGA